MARRAEGVSPLPASALMGSVGKDLNGSAVGDGSNLPTTSMDEERMGGPPGAHVNRGIEPNTNLFGSDSEPMIDTVTAGERPVAGMAFNTPDSSGLLATSGDTDGQPWQGADSTAKNSMPLVIPHDSFSGMGEPPYTKGQEDGRT